MENASKALLMAGGVLIALIIITIFSYVFNLISENAGTEQQYKDRDEIMAFNARIRSI